MFKIILAGILFVAFAATTTAQPPTREDLDKQKLQLKKELEQIDKLKQDNAEKTKGSFIQWKLVNDKVRVQDKIIDNISRDINLLDNNIYTIQRDINKYNRLLDTLKQEYAKSMVYAYKNRSNYDFLNFIFSAGSFNDAIKRIAYLKSYRNYREMQGENILRTQELRQQRLEELTGVKQKKNVVLNDKSKEMDVLEKQKQEKDRIMADLKKQAKQLNAQYAAKNKQLQKIQNMIAAAIERARKEAIAKAAAEAKIKNKSITDPGNKTTITPTAKISAPKKQPESVLLNPDNAALNTKFENNRSSLPWPVDKGYVLFHFGLNELPSGTKFDNPGLTIATDIGASVKAVFAGEVSTIANIEEMQVVIIQHGRYFTTYSNLSGVTVQRGQSVSTGQVIGKVLTNEDGVGAVDFIMSNEKSNFDPARWLRPR